MSDSGIVTAQVGQFTVQSNSGGTAEELSARLKPQTDKAASDAASQLGKRGAEARKAKAAEKPEPEPEQAAEPEAVEAKPADKPIKPIPPKDKAKAEEKAAPEQDKAEEPAEGEEKPEGDEEKKLSSRDRTARMLAATQQAAELKRQLAEERQTRERLTQEFNQRLQAVERGAPRQEQPPAEQRQPQERPEIGPDGIPPLAHFVQQAENYEDGLEQWARAREQVREQRSAQAKAVNDLKERFVSTIVSVKDDITPEIGALEPTMFVLERGGKPDAGSCLADELFFRPEHAPTLVRHFKAHPEDLKRVMEQPSSADVTREVGRILGRLEAATAGVSAERTEQVSRATPPVRPVTGAPYVAESEEYRPGMSLDEYYKRRLKAGR